MLINNLDIKIVTDYTAYTNAIVLQVAVPINTKDTASIYKDIANGDWSQTESDILSAVKKNAPSLIQGMVQALLKAYGGGTGGGGNADPTPPQ